MNCRKHIILFTGLNFLLATSALSQTPPTKEEPPIWEKHPVKEHSMEEFMKHAKELKNTASAREHDKNQVSQELRRLQAVYRFHCQSRMRAQTDHERNCESAKANLDEVGKVVHDDGRP